MIIQYAINTLFAMLSAVLVYMFLNLNFGFVCDKKRILVFVPLFGLVNGIVSSLWMQVFKLQSELQIIRPVIILVLSIQAVKVILKTSWAKAIFSIFFILISIGIANYLAPLIFSLFNVDITIKSVADNTILYFIVNIFVCIISAVFTFITPYIAKLRKIKDLKIVSLLLGFIFLVMMLNMNIQSTIHFELYSYVVISVLTLVFAVSALIIVNFYQKQEERIEEHRQQQFYNDSLSNTLQELRHIKHDQANHLSVLHVMIKNNNLGDADKYLSEILTSNVAINTAIYSIKNVALFSIVSAKMDKAIKAGIKFNLQTAGTVKSMSEIKASELCEIIGIYLDNAIEAAQDSTDKVIDMLVVDYTDSIYIKISNSCSGTPIMGLLKKDGYSTKGTNRGHGLAIAEKLLHKYKNISNTMTFDETFNEFTQIVQIKKAV